MDMKTAADLMDKSWEDIKCAIHPKDDGFLLDAAVMAWIICDADSELLPLEYNISNSIVELMEMFLTCKSFENGTVFIPCNVNEVQCLKDFILRDAVNCLLDDAVPKSAEPNNTGDIGCDVSAGSSVVNQFSGEMNFRVGVLNSATPVPGIKVLNWRDQLCAPDTIGMTMAVLCSRDTLLSAGVLGAVYADLQLALIGQNRSTIDAAQDAVEKVLVDVLPGHVLGQHMGVGDIWDIMASADGSRLCLGGVATGRCGCGKNGPQLSPSRMQGWLYKNAVCISTRHLIDNIDVADAVQIMMRNLKANAARNRLSLCCKTSTVYDVVVSPEELMCIIFHHDNSVAEVVVPKLSNMLVNGSLFFLSAVIIRDDNHYVAYFHAACVRWLTLDGWYYYDGLNSPGRLRYVGPTQCIDKKHAHKIEMALFKRVV